MAGKIYILGGNGDLDLNQIYDPKTDTWSTGTPMPQGTRYASAVATTGQMAPKRIYVLGGTTDAIGTNNTHIYDPKTDSWTRGADMPTARVWSIAESPTI